MNIHKICGLGCDIDHSSCSDAPSLSSIAEGWKVLQPNLEQEEVMHTGVHSIWKRLVGKPLSTCVFRLAL
jgi:hypothetical protein